MLLCLLSILKCYPTAVPTGFITNHSTVQVYFTIFAFYLLQGILHRDLKLENVLLGADRLQVAITDFGLSNSWSQGKILNTYCGSAEYAAPELFAKRNYGPEVPVY